MNSVNHDDPATAPLLCLRLSTDGDPGALTRVLGYFQNLNITPRRVLAELASNARVHVQIEVCGLSEERLGQIAARAGKVPSVLNVYWHRR